MPKRKVYQRQQQAETLRKYWQSDRSKEHRKNLSEAQKRPEVIEKKKAAQKKLWQDPEKKRKMLRDRASGRKLSNADVLEIRRSPLSYSKLGEQYGVSKTTIYAVKNKTKYQHVEDSWGQNVLHFLKRAFERKDDE